MKTRDTTSLIILTIFLTQLQAYLLPWFGRCAPSASHCIAGSSHSTLRETSLSRLFAKKPKNLFSDDFMSALSGNDNGDDEDEEQAVKALMNAKDGKKPVKITLSSEQDDSSSKDSNKKKKKEKNKKKEDAVQQQKEDQEDEEKANTTDTAAVQEPSTTSTASKRSSRMSSKIRLTERTQPSFVTMGLHDVEMVFGDEAVLRNASFTVSTGERVGLVGPNGGGKSTQLKIMYGELTPNRGEVIKSPPNIRVAFLRQEFIDELVLTRTLKEELLSACEEEQRVLREIESCEKSIELLVDDPDKMDDAINRLQELQDQATSLGAYSLDSKIQKIMDSMGFSPEEEDHLVGSFSGGWKMRIGLAKILCTDPNILLLDEPTNHMDFESVLWLEDFLKKQTIPMVIVSHDREFLDQVCNKIVDVEEGKTVSYTGNYSKFLQQRRERLASWRERYDKQMRYVQEEEKWLRKAKNDPTISQTSQVKQREQQLAKFRAAPEFLSAPPKDRKFRFRFPPAPRCGEMLLDAKGLQHGFGSGKYAVLFKDVDYEVKKGNRIGFVGPNGSGKSTMLKIIMGIETPQRGYAEIASSSVQMNYYAQNQADSLNLDHSILEAVQEVASSELTMTEIRGLLGQFLFKGDDVFKKIRMLSGGEKARVALCRMMLKPANLLLLDEPTNHLDITSKEVLEDALLNFAGSVLIVSHDRYFMSQVVNTIFEFGDQTVRRYDCDYHDYLEHLSNPNADDDEEQRQRGEADINSEITLPVIRASTEDDVDDFVAKQRRSRESAYSSLSTSNGDDSDGEGAQTKKGAPSLKDRMTARYVEGDKYKITKAKEVVIEEKNERSKNFGGSGVTSGNLYKGIKNAKRYTM